MLRKIATGVLLVLGALALVPPFFTHGACTAEFEAASDALEHQRPRMGTLERAEDYLKSQALSFKILTAERCSLSPPRDVEVCPGGPMLLVKLPVKNATCRYYRDDTIRLQIGFNKQAQLVHLQTDMNPYRMLKIPLIGLEVDWAR
jgi:hypothetical protein